MPTLSAARTLMGVLNEDLLDYVSRLRPRFKTATLSNSFVGAREREQERYGFHDHFDAIVYSHEEGIEKPAQALYLLACDRLAVTRGTRPTAGRLPPTPRSMATWACHVAVLRGAC